MKKRCTGCGSSPPKVTFNKCARNGDGLQVRCRSCCSEYNRTRYKRLAPQIIARTKAWRKANPERRRASHQAWKKTPAGLRSNRKSLRSLRRRSPEKVLARKLVYEALRTGRLVKKPCLKCRSRKKVQAHHRDYFRPLDVTWLCERCHQKQHPQEARP